MTHNSQAEVYIQIDTSFKLILNFVTTKYSAFINCNLKHLQRQNNPCRFRSSLTFLPNFNTETQQAFKCQWQSCTPHSNKKKNPTRFQKPQQCLS